MSDEREIGGGGSHANEPRIESLARDLALAINQLDARQRAVLRDEAVAILREEVAPDDVELPAPAASSGSGGSGAGKFNAFGIAIPLGLVGALLIFLFPPVGLLMFAAAVVMLFWGVVSVLLSRS